MPYFPLYDDRPDLLYTDPTKVRYSAGVIPVSFFMPRKYQAEQVALFEWSVLLGNPGPKNYITCWSRRSGKDIVHLYLLMRAAMRNVGNYYYFLPTMAMSGRVILGGFTNSGIRYIDVVINPKMILKINKSTNTIYLINGSVIYFLGAKFSGDNFIGHNARGVVMSEFSTLEDPELLYNRLQPILQNNDGFILINFTPRGRQHFSYELLTRATELAKRDPPDWYVSHLGSRELGIFTEEELERIRVDKCLSDVEFKSEYLCHFDSPGDMGQIYGHEVDELKKSGRIHRLIPDICGKKIYVAGDLGIHCATVLILFQWDSIGQRLYIYDVISSAGASFSVYMQKASQWCEENGCVLSTIFLPHDAKKRQLKYGDVSSLYTELMREGFDIVTIPYEQKLTGIYRCRRLFPKTYFNDTTSVAGLIRSLDLYSYVYDERCGKILTSTKSNVHSDFCDAFRYVCSSIRYVNSFKAIDEEKLAWWREQFTAES